MPWIKVLQDFTYKPTPRFMVVYHRGGTYLVKRDCAERAIIQGKAEKAERPKRTEVSKHAN